MYTIHVGIKINAMDKINLKSKLNSFSDHWNPRIVAELNGQYVKVAKIKGEFVWHSHSNEDEMFMALQGEFVMEFRDRTITLSEGECIVVPKGVEHRPVAEEECEIMLFEPKSTVNTGTVDSEFTKTDLEKI